MRHLLLRDVAISITAQSHDKYTNYPPITQLFSQLLAQKNPEKIQFGERIIQKKSRKNPILEQRISNFGERGYQQVINRFCATYPHEKTDNPDNSNIAYRSPLASQEKNLFLFYLIILYIYILYNIYYLYSIYT